MKKIGFIGAFDKTDLIIYVSKLLTLLGKKIIVIDTTLNQKAKYVIPSISPTLAYITSFEDIDFAVGFKSYEEIEEYLGEKLEYDIALVDIDDNNVLNNIDTDKNYNNYFVTAFDLYSLKKGLECLVNLKETLKLTKILFSKQMSKEEEEYLNYISLEYKVLWNEYKFYFPLENGDREVLAENQRLAKLNFKNLSREYKDGVMYIVQDILKDCSLNEIKRVMKNIERGV